MKPPALAEWTLRSLVRPGLAADIIGDLREEYSRYTAREVGRLPATLWYWRQVVSVLLRFGRFRLRSPRTFSRLLSRYGDEQPPAWLGLRADVRHSVRALVRSPRYSWSVVLIFSLGIGVTTAVFSAVKGVLLDPLPYERPDELVLVGGRMQGVGLDGPRASMPEYRDYLREAESISELAAYLPGDANIGGEIEPAQVALAFVTPNFFSLLGVDPTVGRDLRQSDVVDDVGSVILLSHEAWQRYFDRDPYILGRRVVLDGDPYSVVGVMPREFAHPAEQGSRRVDAWVPIDAGKGTRFDARWLRSLVLIGRLRHGSSVQASQEELSRIAWGQRRAYPDVYPADADWSVWVHPLYDETVGDAKSTLMLLFGSVGLVFLAVVVNLANLQLSRGAARSDNLALRSAMGGSRARIVRQLCMESTLLGLAGSAVGLGLALTTARFVGELMPRGFPRLGNIHVDGVVFAFAVGAGIVSLVAFGMLPALRVSGVSIRGRMRQQTAGGRHRGTRLRDTLVRFQTAFSLVVLVGAGLMLKSYEALRKVDPGFDPEGVLTLETWLPMPADPGRGSYRDPERRIALFEDVLEAVGALPDVTGAAVADRVPLQAGMGFPISVEGAREGVRGSLPTAQYRIVSDAYFEVMGIEMLKGRSFGLTDRLGSPGVAIVSRAFSETYFGGESPVGHRVSVGGVGAPALEILGEVDDVGHGSLGRPPEATVYTSVRQNAMIISSMTIAVRTTGDDEAVSAHVADALQRVDPQLPAPSALPMKDLVEDARSEDRALAALFSLFSMLTLVLSAMGIYAVVSSAVIARTPEIGVRRALGGSSFGVLGLLMSQGLTVGLHGAGMGLVVAALASRPLASVLYQVGPLDPQVYVFAAVLAVAIVALASLGPSLDAVRIDPSQTIRAD